MIEFDIPDVKYKSRFLSRNFKYIRLIFKHYKKDIRSNIKEHYKFKGMLGIRFEFYIYIEDEWITIYVNSDNKLQTNTIGNNAIIIIKCTTLDNTIEKYIN